MRMEGQGAKSGKKLKNLFTIRFINSLERENKLFFPETAKNQLKNGNLEEIEDPAVSRIKLTKWIDADCAFYKNDSLILPKHDNLLGYWEAPPKENYPKVSLTSERPIEGAFSLLVELQDKNIVYLSMWICYRCSWFWFQPMHNSCRIPPVFLHLHYRWPT